MVKAVKRKHISTSYNKPSAKSLRSDSESLDVSWSTELAEHEARHSSERKQNKSSQVSAPLTPLQQNVSFNSDILNESLVEEKRSMDKYEQFLLQSLEQGKSFSLPNSPGAVKSPIVRTGSPKFAPSPAPMRSPQFVLRPSKAGKSPKPDPLRKIYEKTPILMDEKIENLKLMLSEQQKEDRLFEMRLKRASLMSPI